MTLALHVLLVVINDYIPEIVHWYWNYGIAFNISFARNDVSAIGKLLAIG